MPGSDAANKRCLRPQPISQERHSTVHMQVRLWWSPPWFKPPTCWSRTRRPLSQQTAQRAISNRPPRPQIVSLRAISCLLQTLSFQHLSPRSPICLLVSAHDWVARRCGNEDCLLAVRWPSFRLQVDNAPNVSPRPDPVCDIFTTSV